MPWCPNWKRSAAQTRVDERSNRSQGTTDTMETRFLAPVLQLEESCGREPQTCRFKSCQGHQCCFSIYACPRTPIWQRDTDQSRGGGSSNLPEGTHWQCAAVAQSADATALRAGKVRGRRPPAAQVNIELMTRRCAGVAQLVDAVALEAIGWRFESSRPHP